MRTGELIELVVEPGVADGDIERLVAQAATPGAGPYDVTVFVDKRRLVGSTPTPTATVRLYLLGESVRRALARGIAHFEAEVWPGAPEPLLLALLDTDVLLTGPYLTVAGGASLAGGLADGPQPAGASLDVEAVLAGRDRHIGWDTPWAQRLTPWHFQLDGHCADADLEGLLRAQLVKLAVLFTCDRARTRAHAVPPGPILAEYRGREHVAVVPIDERAPIGCTPEEAGAVLRAVDWCYERQPTGGRPDWVSDRLPFVQTRLAQAVEPHPEEARLAVLVRSMPYLLEGIERQWKAFVEGRVGEYLDRVQQVETLVGDTVTNVADRTLALAKGLTDAILAAVAVLIGSFIAAAFARPFNATLFRIGVLTYAGYVALFPCAVGLAASRSALKAARAQFDARVARFRETLYPEKVDEIVGRRVDDVQRTYERWWVAAALIYLGVAVLACVAAAFVPRLIG